MTCPKCRGEMKTFDRAGVHVEQCTDCRGIFLDYGELDQIVGADQRFNAPPPLPDGPHGQPAHQGYRSRPDSPAPYGRGGYDGGYSDSPRPYGRKRKGRSIFDQLFD